MTGTARSPRAIAAAVLAGVAVVAVPTPTLSTPGTYALATTAFAGTLWVTGGLPLPATALCVPVLLAGLGVQPTLAAALAGFADPVVFLVLAGFVLAAALSRHDLDRRLAYRLVLRLGTTPARLVLAVMVATAALSAVVSNSATTAMMVPVALGVARTVGSTESPPSTDTTDHAPDTGRNLEVALLLGTAYAASLGGMTTLVGTPANAVVVGAVTAGTGLEIGFLDWLVVGLPAAVVGVPLAWLLLVRWLYPPASGTTTPARRAAAEQLAALGPPDAAARRTLVVTAAVVGLWLLGGLDFLLVDVLPTPLYDTLFGGAGSVVGTETEGLLYYVLVGVAAVPTLLATDCLAWADVAGVDWGTLLLLGGGLSLADGLAATDATRWLADATLGRLGGGPLLVILVVVLVTVVLSEVASNTATAAVFAPVLLALGPRYAAALGTDAPAAGAFLAVCCGVAASLGFALPVATPPNAIAFGTGAVDREDMLRAGVLLDLGMAAVTTLLLLAVLRTVWPLLL